MRAALWLLVLFGIAAAVALFAGNNQGTVTLFWPPYRVDLSLNLVLLLLVLAFIFVHAALRAMAALFSLPQQALRWRTQQRERAMHGALLDSLSHLLAGRFTRSRRAAEAALVQEQTLAQAGCGPANCAQVRSLAHLLAAESAHALQDKAAREGHLQQALDEPVAMDAKETREGAVMRAANWSLDDGDAQAAIGWLKELSQGAARRTLALRMRLKASQLAGEGGEALDTARLLAKHHAFSPAAAKSIVRGLAIDTLNKAYDVGQLQRAWALLEPAERLLPEVAIHAAQRLASLGGDSRVARDWLLSVWEAQARLDQAIKIKLVRALEEGLDTVDADWLSRIEAAQKADPRDANLQYLAGIACLKRQLWGKAQQLMSQAALGLQDARLRRNAWRALAVLAEQREDAQAAADAWKRAAAE